MNPTEIENLRKAIEKIRNILNNHDQDNDPWSDSLDAIDDIVNKYSPKKLRIA